MCQVDSEEKHSKRKTTQASPTTTTPTSSQSATPSVTTTTTQGPAQSIGGGDEPPEKNISIAPTCQGGSLPFIGSQAENEEKKIEEMKDGTISLVSPSPTTPTPSLNTTLFSSPHITPIPSPHHNPTPFASASLLKPTGSPI